jgi:hypothetical protein
MHLHYSPFQFATDTEVSTGDVSVKKVVKVLKALTKSDKVKDMGSTMSCAAAAEIPGSPNAFISPNPIGVMKDLKAPMAPALVRRTTAGAPAYDAEYRGRSRLGYGDR